MQSSEIVKAPLKTSWAMIDPLKENRKKHEAGITSVENRRIAYGTRVNNNKYALHTRNGRVWSEDINDFRTTEERTYGYLMKIVRPAGDIYAVVKPLNFVATQEEYDNYWVVENERRKQEREIQAANAEIQHRRSTLRHEIRREREAQALPEAERTAESIRESIAILLGQRALVSATVKVAFEGTWEDEDSDEPKYQLQQSGTVTLTLQHFQRLLEKAVQD